jgi:hypothetical protein
MFGKKTPPPPKPPLALQILSVDYVIDGQLADTIEDGLTRPWLMRIGNPAVETVRGVLPLTQARVQATGPGAAPARTAAQFNVWFQNIIAVLPGEAAGQQQIVAWAKDTLRKRSVRGIFYVGPYVISGTALTKETEFALSLVHLVAVLDATIYGTGPGALLPELRSPALLLSTERMIGFEQA